MKLDLSHPWLTKNIIYMGLVSFFNDMSTEMMYPILPVFLTSTLGASPADVGLVYGLARGTENIARVFFGFLSDKTGNRKAFIFLGYFISCISKGIIGFAFHWHVVLIAFFFDRFGKSIRNSPRDVLLVEDSASLFRARIFGFQRAADTFGAVVGPLCTMMILSYIGEYLRLIFFLTVIPALIAIVLLVACVQENNNNESKKILPIIKDFLKLDFTDTFKLLGRKYYFFLFACMIFYLSTGVENFFILKSQSIGIVLSTTVFIYMIYNLVYALCAYPVGIVADVIGTRVILFFGFIIFSGVSLAFGFAQNQVQIAVLFSLQGFYMALTKGVARAHISLISAKDNMGFAFGLHDTLTGICMFLGSYATGILWSYFDNRIPFFVGSALAVFAAMCIFLDIVIENFFSSQ